MERRGEGFERERIQPEPERRFDPLAGGHTHETPRTAGSEYVPDVRHEDTYPGRRPMLYNVQWSSVIIGFFATLSLIVLVGALGIGLGFTTGTMAAVWAAITMIVAFFCGAYFAARTCSEPNPTMGLIHGLAVWAVAVFALLVLGSLGLLGTADIGGFLGDAARAGTGNLPANLSPASMAGWGAFAALGLGLIASAVGGWTGGHGERRYDRGNLVR